MTSSESIVRFVAVLCLGMICVLAVAYLTGLFFPMLKLPIVVIFCGLWLYGGIGTLRQERDGADAAKRALSKSLDWDVNRLPIEFRFIRRSTRLMEVIEKVGPYSKVRGSGEIKAMQFDLPSGGSILIFPAFPFAPSSAVRGILFVANHDDVGLFP